MIVFWRLFLALFLTDFVFFHRSIHRIQQKSRLQAMAIRSVTFAILALAFCHRYLTHPWPFLEEFTLPGWVCIILFALFHGFTDYYYQFGGKVKGGYTLTFFIKNTINVLFLVLMAPFKTLYETGNFFAEPWVVFLVGVVLATRVLGWFIFAVEQDKYGREYPTFDEQWLLALVRAVFFLIMLLPGLRWAVVFVVWMGTCIYARRIRLIDVPRWAFLVGAFGAAFIGLLVRLRLYLVG
ncbi:MAG: hypothetical protein IJ876_05740 [Elusimicrobiaceae bacterium]|nr:hypothetical protein [Elusimicrobiaceae bacterium]